MKLTITRDNLLAASSRAVSFTARKNIVPILSYGLFEASSSLTVTATDLERQISEVVECEIERGGKAVLPIAQLSDIAKKLPKSAIVSLEVENDRVTIKAGRYETTMQTLPPEDFPCINSVKPSCTFNISANVLRDSFHKISFAMSTEETRYYLCGVHIHTDGDKLKFVATDGHRLALSRVVKPDVSGSFERGVIIPRSVVSDICRLLDGGAPVEVSIDEHMISFSIGQAVITSKLVDGTFPDYKRVIPTADAVTMTVGKELLETVERVAAVSSEKSRPIKLTVGDGEVVLNCADPQGSFANDAISAKTTGEKIDIGFQARYLADMLSQVSGDSVWKMSDSSSPARITDTGNADVLFVMMPMRI